MDREQERETKRASGTIYRLIALWRPFDRHIGGKRIEVRLRDLSEPRSSSLVKDVADD